MQKIVTTLWFDKEAEEAVSFYTSVFKDLKVQDTMRYGQSGAEVSNQPEGSVMTISFQLLGQDFIALNGGPIFKFTEAISFMIPCKDQEEVDYYWEKLSEDGDVSAQQCGWLKDKFGLSWQIVPEELGKIMNQSDPVKAEKVAKVFYSMKKIDIEALKEAAR